jgi:hypothetical protein
MANVNLLAVLVSAILSMVIGSIWYGPLFGKRWMKLIKMTKEDMEKGKANMPKTYGMMFVGSLVTSYVLALVINTVPIRTVAMGLTAAFWIWLGFIVAVKLSEVLFEKKVWELFFIECGYYFIFLGVAGAIFGAWS